MPASTPLRDTLPADTRKATLAAYFALTWLHVLWESAAYLRNAAPAADLSQAFAFHLATWAGYSSVYVALALLPAMIAARFFVSERVFRAVAVVATVLMLLIVRIDRTVFDLYNFHINGFVLNLVMTPGGIESLGGGADSYFSLSLVVLRIIAMQAVMLMLARRIAPWFSQQKRRVVTVVCALMLVYSQISYGIGDLRNNGPILDTADNYPLFLRVRFRGLATQLGFPPVTRERSGASARVDTSRLQYPLQAMHYEATTRPLNIVWLVAESLRWDQLSPEIMPNTWALAQRGQHFLNHYSSGNGTREGLFGMFYGLYGSYWDNFLHAGRGPLLIDRMQALNYQMELRTSARFTYPEFDKTLFVKVPPALMHEDEFTDNPWMSDRDNTSALLAFVDRQQAERPFMTFMFFESTHARYNFPESSAIRKPYLESIDYTDMSRENLALHADELRNRYSNAAHWVDVQIGRIVDHLGQKNLLDNTVIIVTGDHGEEFMEKGFWGHNSSFVEEQTHTPLVLLMPGMAPQKIERTTSHMDISVTLMQLLGASNDVGDYAQGANLFDPALHHTGGSHDDREFIVVSDWHSIGIKAKDFKYRVPYTSRGMENFRPTRGDDSAFDSIDAEHQAIADHKGIILEAVRNISRLAK